MTQKQKSIWTMGEALVEIMRPRAGMALAQAGEFLGPFPSGAPAIFIDTVARLGHPAGMIGGVGADDFGDCVVERLEGDGVDCRYIQRYAGYSTAVAFVTYFTDGSRKFLYHIDRTPAVMTPFDAAAASEDAGFFHVMGCSLMANADFRQEIIKAMRAFADHGARISFDPNIRAELLRDESLEAVIGPVMERCAVFLPGVSELRLVSGETDIDAAAAKLIARYPLEVVVVKRGRDGCRVYPRDGAARDVPAYAVQEVDPTGAGDCFDAGFLCGLLEGCSLPESARIASAAGALDAAAFGPMEGAISGASVRELIESAER